MPLANLDSKSSKTRLSFSKWMDGPPITILVLLQSTCAKFGLSNLSQSSLLENITLELQNSICHNAMILYQ